MCRFPKVNNPHHLFEGELSQASIEAPTLEDDNQKTSLHKIVNSDWLLGKYV